MANMPDWFTEKVKERQHYTYFCSDEIVPQKAAELFLAEVGMEYTYDNRKILDIIGDRWTDDHDEYHGSFPKRFSSWLYKQYSKKIDRDRLAVLGEQAKRMIIPANTEYDFDFTQDFDWDAGDFGDGGSCFWGDRNKARTEILPNYNAWAVRFWSDGKGHSRSWLVPDWKGREAFLLFNGYGLDYSRQANILAAFFEQPTKKVDFECDNDGKFWCNTDDAYAIGPCSSSSFEIITGSMETCEWCNDEYDEDDMTYVDGIGLVCSDCYESHKFCQICNEWLDNDDVDSIRIDGRGWRDVCQSCREDYRQCYHCDKWFDDSQAMVEVDGDMWCSDCAEGLTPCKECGILSNRSVEIEGETYCQDHMGDAQRCDLCNHYFWELVEEHHVCQSCYESHICDGCHEYHGYLVKVDDQRLCDTCREKSGAKMCWRCDTYSTSTRDIDGYNFCPTCFEYKEPNICPVCGKATMNSLQQTPFGPMCTSCLESRGDYSTLHKCWRCGKWTTDDIHINDRQPYCQECIDYYVSDNIIAKCPDCGGYFIHLDDHQAAHHHYVQETIIQANS